MATRFDEDEFDALPDMFEGVDWDSIPAMTQCAFYSVGGSATVVDHSPLPNSSQHSAPAVGSGEPNTPSSEDYGLDDLDESFLGEVDALERSLTQRDVPSMSGPSTSSESTSLSGGGELKFTLKDCPTTLLR